jgi:hypothetical protein
MSPSKAVLTILRFHHPEVRRVNGRPILGDLCEQPLQKLDRKQRVSLEAILTQRDATSHHLDIDEPGFSSDLNQRLLRKRTGQSAGVGRFVLQDLFGQASIHDRVGEDQPAAGTQHAEDLPEQLVFRRDEVDHAVADGHIHARIG